MRESGKSDEKRFAFLDGLPQCPPSNAKPVNGTFYACHSNKPPSGEDFKTSAQRDVNRKAPECIRRACSINADPGDARGMIQKFPNMFSHVSRGKLKPPHGVFIETPRQGNESHCSFWRYEDVSMFDLFCEPL